MALTSGTQIGLYQIVDQIGSGGMGEVYRATDTKLGRDIAIKMLPSALAQEPDRLARFEREAKLLATLNHAHIGAIYGLDEHEGTQFIAMELVEGQTLEERLRDGALPTEDALRIALQIAEALEAAHEKGVVHRDLKPANIMLTRDGVAKVLDFGLAKAFSGDPNAATPAHSPALSVAMTQQGLILGTAGYMSPEQASGQATDQRADIWAFGVVLYEMLTGLPLFSGESVPHILADVLRSEPDWSRLPRNVHPRIRQMLERCLEKKVRSRYHSIADVRVDIEKVLSQPEHAALEAAAVTVPPTWRRLLPFAITAAVTLLVASFAAWSLRPPGQTRLVTRFDFDIPEGQTLRNTAQHVLAVSADGRKVVYNTTDGLYLRSLEELDAHVIPGTEPALAEPAFSPDGLAVAYWESGQLKRISVTGGGAVPIAQVPVSPEGMSWTRDGTILFCGPKGVMRVAATGGTPELAIAQTDGSQCYSPRLLPDGDSVLFSTYDAAGQPGSVVVQSISNSARQVLLESGGEARYVSTGHLVYMVGNSLFAVTFDPDERRVSGGPVPLEQGIMQLTNAGLSVGSADYDVSESGTLVYVAGGVTTNARTLVWLGRLGGEEDLSLPARTYASPRLSPDGTKLAINARDEELDIWVWDLVRKTRSRLTRDPGNDRFPVWSRDGTRIYFSSTRNGTGQQTSLYWKAADGTGPAEKVVDAEAQLFPTSVLPNDAGVLAYGALSGIDDNDDVMLVGLRDTAQVVTLLDSEFGESMPEISPDGSLLAYVSNESGRNEVYVRPFPDVESGGRQPVSTDGGTQPLWARDGSELFYLTNEGALMAVAVQREPIELGAPQQLLDGQFVMNTVNGGGRSYDVSLDGQRFLAVRPAGGTQPMVRIVVAMNWAMGLERLVPTK